DLLDLVDQVRLNGVRAARLEQVVGVDAAAGQRVARLDALAVLDDHADVAVDAVRLDELAVVRRHGDAGLVLVLLDGHDAVELTDDGLDLGLAGLDELDHARQTLRDVGAGRDAAGVEGTHRELGARLADRLGGDGADGLTEADVAHEGHVEPVAGDAHARLGLTGGGPAHGDRADLRVVLHEPRDGLDVLHVEDRTGFEGQLANLEVERQPPAVKAHVELAARTGTVFWGVERDLQELRAAAVLLAHDDLVGHVDQLAGEVTGVGGSQGRIGATLAGAVGRDEVLEHVEALAEVRADRQLDSVA